MTGLEVQRRKEVAPEGITDREDGVKSWDGEKRKLEWTQSRPAAWMHFALEIRFCKICSDS